MATTACADLSGSAAEPTVDAVLRFDGSAPTLDALGERVLAALSIGDTAALERFRLTEQQHNEVVWPELPASAPEVNFPVDFAWQNISMRNLRAVRRLTRVFAAQELDFHRVECRGVTETFETFEVLTDCWVVFERAGDGRPWEAQLFKDVLSRGGGYMVFRYYEEQPEPFAGTTAR